MQSVYALELLARERMQNSIDQAARDALADLLTRPSGPSMSLWTLSRRVVRGRLATGLRGLAARLDPSVTGEVGVFSAPSRATPR